MSAAIACLALLAWGFGMGYMVGQDRKERAERRRRPFQFTWKCGTCGSWANVGTPSIDAMGEVEAFLTRSHQCPGETP